MCGISKYEEKKCYENGIFFDSRNELHELDLKRLINLQNKSLENISYYLINNSIIDKNTIYTEIQELLIINKVIKYKLKKDE